VLRPYDLLENVLIDIEKNIREGINSDFLAEKYTLSERHLRKLFKFAFKLSLGSYIRSRKLAASLDDLLKTDANILNIALEYDFDYEQSYINAFKREFGITPGNLRKSGHIVKIKPPLQLFDENKLADGLIFGPDIVMVPKFHVIGRHYLIPLYDSPTVVPKVTIQFWENDRSKISNTVNSTVIYGITRNNNHKEECKEYMPSLQVKDLKNIPQGFRGDTIDTSLCARFRYFGEHPYYDLNYDVLSGMYNKIRAFAYNDQANYSLLYNQVIFIKIDTRLYDGKYCQFEWFAPITEKR
jgi:AraC family transcriptional regulator